MVTDAQILDSLTGNVRRIPYPGEWLVAPFEGKGAAVVARDGESSELRVDRRQAGSTASICSLGPHS